MPEYADKALNCVDCGAEFTFTAGEQERFAQLGFTNEPKRCAPCRAEKKRMNGERNPGRGGAPPGGQREMHVTKCSGCGGEARVPFKPRGDRPVYCSACFTTNRR